MLPKIFRPEHGYDLIRLYFFAIILAPVDLPVAAPPSQAI